jgi:hypothetical protein
MDPAGLCATCRYVVAELARYTAQPWDVSYQCAIRAQPLAPKAIVCHHYEREPGTD